MQIVREFNSQLVPPPPAGTPRWPEFPSLHAGPVDLELGAGAGLHAIQYSRAHPERFLIAIERTEKAVRLISRARNHPELHNLLPIRADALNWVSHEVPPGTIDECFILYPNPYPKKRHSNLRWQNMPFMGYLISRLKPAGRITMATNSPAYAAEARRMMTGRWGLTLSEDRLLPGTDRPRTHFEKKYLGRNEPCWNLVFSRPVSQ
jgi:tRNA (guanine-N7-)-methyltransferase